MKDLDMARESLGVLISDVVTKDRFVKWKEDLHESARETLGRYAFGEIFWRKSLGRPTSARLSDAFTIEAWRDDPQLGGDVGGAAKWFPVRLPYWPSLWDGKDDGEYWRVAYSIANLVNDHPAHGFSDQFTHTHIVPHFAKGVTWDAPGGLHVRLMVGLRTLDPSGVSFVKKDGPVHFSFEVVHRPLRVSP